MGAIGGWLEARLGARAGDRGHGKSLTGPAVTTGVVLAAALAALALAYTTPFRFVEYLTWDLRLALTAPQAAAPITIVKIDDAAMKQVEESSACKCTSPLDKIWLATLIADLDRKGARAVGVDVLVDNWRSPEEYAEFARILAPVKMPVIAGHDPALTPGVDFPATPPLRYADPRALMSVDYDHVMRRYDPAPGGKPSLAQALATAVGGEPMTGPFYLRYRAPSPQARDENAGAIGPSFSAAFVPDLPEAFFRDRIVLIGRVTRSAGADAQVIADDMHMTPLRFLPGHYAGTPGVEVHAHALAQMLAGDHIIKPGLLWLFLTILIGAAGGALFGRVTPRWWVAAVIIVGAVALAGGVAFAALAFTGVMLPLTGPATGLTLAFLIMSRLAALELQDQRAFFSSTLERYLAPQVIERMVGSGEPVRIGAERREITVMVTDLENFSNLVSGLSLHDFSELINAYFDGLIEVLWRHEAMVDKMTGDGVIALFGAPADQPDHAARALNCARDISGFAEDFRAEMAARLGVKLGRTRMGLHSGGAMVGNFGGKRRFNYTAYGPVVVIAARLEAANKEHETTLLFSEATLDGAGISKTDARKVGTIALKGVPEPVNAWTLEEGLSHASPS